jgi:hypothetical protein
MDPKNVMLLAQRYNPEVTSMFFAMQNVLRHTPNISYEHEVARMLRHICYMSQSVQLSTNFFLSHLL